MSTETSSATGRAGFTFVRETSIVFNRQLRLALGEPSWIIIGLLQPVLYLVLFGPLLEPIASQLGTDNAYTLFVPGLIVQLAVFGALFVGFGLLGEYRDGVIEAEQVTPASRTALLLGRVAKDVMQIFVQGLILIVLGFAFGLRGSIVGMLAGFALALALSAAVASAGYALALTVKAEDALAAIGNGVALPILLLSGILLPLTIAPEWLQRVSDLVPIKHIVEGIRELFVGDFESLGVMWALVWTVMLAAAGIWIGTRTFRSQNE